MLKFWNIFDVLEQTERDDLTAEVSLMRDRLEKSQTASGKALEERDAAGKELERLLEKYDRSQGEVYRLQSKLDTALAEQERLRTDCEKSQLLTTRWPTT